MIKRIPPQDLAAEQGVLGCILVHGNMDDIEISPDDFYDRRHGKLFQVMSALHADGQPIDEITVVSRLTDMGRLQEVGGLELIGDLGNIAISPAHGVHYSRLVKAKARARAFLEASQEAQDKIYAMPSDIDSAIEEGEQLIYEAASGSGESRGPRALSEGLQLCLHNLEQKASGGISSGFREIDSLICGLFPGDLFILAGRPGMGKSMLAFQIGVSIASRVGPVAIFSLEMTEDNCIKRILSGEASVPYERIRDQQLTAKDWQAITIAADKIYNLPLFIDDSQALHHLDIRKRARRLCSKHGLKLVIVDYLQLARGNKDSREEEVSEISMSLKALAKEMKLPVLALCQLNRKCEERTDKRPLLSDLRNSGSIEQDADVVAFVYRDKLYNENANDVAEIIIRKQRNGPLGTAKLYFRGAVMRFETLDYEH